MSKYLLYFHINLLTKDVFYVGIGNEKRPYVKSTRSRHWKNIVRKYGYEIKIIERFDNWGDAVIREKFYIRMFGKTHNKTGSLVNHTDGGDGSPGVSSWNKGQKMKEESRLKMIKSRTGQKQSQETKDKIGSKMKGRIFSAETRRKNSEALTGRKLSDETKKKLSEAAKKQWQTGNTWYNTA